MRLNKINDMKYKLILNIANKDNKYDSNEFIVSLAQKGTFLISRDISSIDENDLKNKIFDITYNIGEIIEINNTIFVSIVSKFLIPINKAPPPIPSSSSLQLKIIIKFL